MPYGKTITLNGVDSDYSNIEKGIQINIGDKSTGYQTGLIFKSTYYPHVDGITFSNGNKIPLKLTKEQLIAGALVDNKATGISVTATTSSGSSTNVSISTAQIGITPTKGNSITFAVNSRVTTASNGTLDWILNDIIVI